MEKRYKVTFEIQGVNLEGEVKLNKQNLRIALDKELNVRSPNYYSNRDLDTHIEDLKIEKVKAKLVF